MGVFVLCPAGSVRRFDLAGMNLDDFCNEVLKLTSDNRDCIVHMCRLASQSKYQQGSRIKTELVDSNHLMKRPGSDGCASGRNGAEQHQGGTMSDE